MHRESDPKPSDQNQSEQKQNSGRVNRREFLRLSMVAGAGTVLAACGGGVPLATPVPAGETVPPATAAAAPTTAAGAAAPTAYQEAPMLAELVAAGSLPPVEERLPKTPKVLPAFESIGQYGGTWRRAYRGPSDRFGVHTTIVDHLLEMYAPDGAGSLTLIPNVAESYEVNEDATEFTWNLREGHKWSDGTEITSENAVWWYQNILLNEELAPGRLYDNVRQQQNLTDVVANGTYSFKTLYSAPNGTLPLGVVRGEAWGIIGGLNFMVPSHYLAQYHPTFADADFLESELERLQLQSWVQMFLGGPIDMFAFNPELPMVGAWVTTVAASSEQMVQTRNPYYFQVDEEGKQLPYLDEITHEFFENQESFNLMCISGQIDCQFRHVQLTDFTFLKENEAAGNYTVRIWNDDSNVAFIINPTPRDDDGNVDEAQSAVVSRADFRRALSLAVNREEVSNLLYNGLAAPRQAAPVESSPVYKAEYEQAYAAYDLDQANALLDGLGLTERDSNNIRLREDGEPITLRLDVDAAPGTILDDLYQLIKGYWEAAGVAVNINAQERTLRETLQFSDRYSVILGGVGNTATPLAFDAWHNTINGGWGRFLRNAEDPLAIEPPADDEEIAAAAETYAIIEEAYSLVDLDAAHTKLMEALDIFYEQCYQIGVVGGVTTPGVVHNRMKNVPQSMLFTNALMRVNMGQPAQFYIEE
jgi:peptide/nickel transport system substrate-binding protein